MKERGKPRNTKDGSGASAHSVYFPSSLHSHRVPLLFSARLPFFFSICLGTS
jgi:hypothetical protein